MASPPEPMDSSPIMTRPLRRAHRYIWLGLSGVLPTLLMAGLVLRPPQAPEERVMDRITLRLPNGTEMVADSRELWGNAVDAPDPLVYWSKTFAASVAEARLVGSLTHGRRAVLSVPAAGGYLILYSLAHREVLARAPAPKEMP
jgi:hypothetical protein